MGQAQPQQAVGAESEDKAGSEHPREGGSLLSGKWLNVPKNRTWESQAVSQSGGTEAWAEDGHL